MIYCMTIQDEAGEVVVTAVFDLHKDGIDCEGYKLRGVPYPACTPWEFMEHVAKSVDLGKLSAKSQRSLVDLAAYIKP